jgi:hypothetical protein
LSTPARREWECRLAKCFGIGRQLPEPTISQDAAGSAPRVGETVKAQLHESSMLAGGR